MTRFASTNLRQQQAKRRQNVRGVYRVVFQKDGARGS
jgi:hypothetical protein